MSARYLLHFVQDHLTFRWNEFRALTSKYRCKFKLITEEQHLLDKPYIVVEVSDDDNADRLIKSAQDSFLLRGLYELWAQSDSLGGIVKSVNESKPFKSGSYLGEDQTFKINCESYGKKLSQETKISWIEQLHFLNSFKANPDMRTPKQTFFLLNYCPNNFNRPNQRQVHGEQEYYFCRQMCASNKSEIHKFNLKARKFIANTTMDPLLSFVTANIAKVDKNHIVYDPFVGSGGLLIPAAYMGAYVLGTDIDFLLLHGRSKPSRHDQKVREDGESVRGNLVQYGLEKYYLDVVVSDVSRSPLNPNFRVDSIIADPPYGVRESSERIGTKKVGISSVGHKVRYPAKTNYLLEELLKDLLLLAARHLTVKRRLVYFLPYVTTCAKNVEDCLPSHPSLKLLSFCEQNLTPKISRLLVIMEKTKECKDGERVSIPESLMKMNFRDAYFGS